MQGKWREFLVLMIPGLIPGRSFTWPHLMQDRDWLPSWKRKDQKQIHVIEYEAYTHLKAENESLEHILREYNESVANFVQGNSDVSTALPDCFGKNCGVVLVEYTKKIQEQNKKLKAALEKILNSLDAWHQFHDSDGLWKSYHSARTTLAEIGGE